MESNTSRANHEPEVVQSLAAHFAFLTDQRKPRGLRYPLTPLLVLIVLAKLCEADKPIEIAKWVEYRRAGLLKVLGLSWPRMPHHSTRSPGAAISD